VSDADLHQGLEVEHALVGKGYGHPTAAGQAATEAFERSAGPALDPVYSAKAAAGLFEASGPTLFWSTKSSASLPDERDDGAGPWLMRRWLDKTPLFAPALPLQRSYRMLMGHTDD
tara:strand:+ start:807 stop:1154 length:348 start_codon:yes stop_codon:yes gene_type:complete